MDIFTNETRLLRTWKLLLCVFALLVLAVAAFHAYFFIRLNAGDVFVVSGEARDETIVSQKKAVRRANHVFEEKAARRASAQEQAGTAGTQPTFADPSL